MGVVVAVIQTAKAREARDALLREQRNRNASIWHNIALVLNAYETIEDARAYSKELSTDVKCESLAAKLSSARRCIVDQYLDLLKAAILDEPAFTEDTIKMWIDQGKLQTEWRVQQARKFLRVESKPQ
jgi:hypothetical protein